MKKEIAALVLGVGLFILYAFRPWGQQMVWLTTISGLASLALLGYCVVLEFRDNNRN